MNAASRFNASVLGNWWLTVDRWLLAAALALIAVGVVMAFAASPAVAERLGYGDFHFVRRHLAAIPVAVALMLAVSLLVPVGVLRVSVPIFAGGLALTAATLVAGAEINGAHRWLTLGSLSLQPSELLKPGFAVVAAALLAAGRGHYAAILLVAVVSVLVLQPDIGMALTIALVWFAQCVVAGLPLFWVGVLAGLGAAALAAGYRFLPHVESRIDRFLDPEAGDSYQMDRSLQAFAEGGVFGRGPGEGVVKAYLPDAHADLVFAVVGEEFGLLASLALVGVFAFFVLRGIARLTVETDRFVAFAGVGLIAHFGLQAMANMAVALRMVPTKGLTLPFVSYGGSSLLAAALAVGMTLALTRWRPRIEPVP